MRSRVPVLVVGVALVACGMVWAGEIPVAVSPGRPDTGAAVASHCPTFSWGMVPGASSYELLVYQVDEDSEDTKPVLRESFSGSVHGWTPSLDHCLERGGRYAWSVRAVFGKESAGWSMPNLFEVASGPSAEEFEEAFQVVRDYLAQGDTEGMDLAIDEQSSGPPNAAPRVAARPVDGQAVRSGAGSVGRESAVDAAASALINGN